MDKVSSKKFKVTKKEDKPKLAKIKTMPLKPFPRIYGKSGVIVNSGDELGRAKRDEASERIKSRAKTGNDWAHEDKTAKLFDKNTKKLAAAMKRKSLKK